MLTKNEIKQLRALQLKKGREEHSCFVCEGNKLVSELLSSRFKVREIFATHQWESENPKSKNIRVISTAEMEKISQMATAPGVLAVVEMPKFSEIKVKSLKNELFFVLDQVKDPGNLGTIVRIADWFGLKAVICSEDTVELFNHKTIQASMGSAFRIPVFYTNIKKIINECTEENIPLFAAVMNGKADLKISSGGIILGNESNGVKSELIRPEINKITIPSFGEAESLNVAIAAGILAAKVKW